MGQVSQRAHVQVRLRHFVRLCCLPAGWAAVARVAMQCVDYFLPYIEMTGHVVSPVMAGGQ